jgi:REP element-mobilizing transposase RayT
MPRQARLVSPGLLQHVIGRGIERSPIFLDDDDRENFVARLHRLLTETRTVCYAWTLLNNHFHLLLMPTEASLSTLMRRLLTGYAISFNHRHRRAGHLFQNRYHSVVCDNDPYLLELVRYIHLNPLRAGVVADLSALADYRWCGHQQLLGRGKVCLLPTAEVLAIFWHDADSARQAYLQFLADGIEQGMPSLSPGGRRTSQALGDARSHQPSCDERILGDGDFATRVLPPVSAAEPALPLDELVATVAQHYGIDAAELSWPSKARAIANAKAVLCFLVPRRYRLAGVEVARLFGVTPSAVSRAAQRGQGLLAEDVTLQKIIG